MNRRLSRYLLPTSVGLLTLIVALGLLYWLLPPEYKLPFLRLIAIVGLVICIFIIIIDLIFLLPTVGGAIYLPSSELQIKTILKLANIKNSDKAVDIGSGDGRIVIALARAGAQAYGYEINPLLVRWSQLKMRTLPVNQRGSIRLSSFWYVNFAKFDVITIFGMSYIMKGLEAKLLKELKPGARVICNSFPFPNWKPSAKENSVYLYVKA